jgi:lysylphosphatidylglycerol synthetase-like protein (DUF2156 family)
MRLQLSRAGLSLVMFALLPLAHAQHTAWRQASNAELAAVLPSRAQVQGERIETEMRTASGIINTRGQAIAGVVLITAGYSADGKYSHFLLVQVPIRLGGVVLKAGNYAFGWTRSPETDTLEVHLHAAATGVLIGTTVAHRIAGAIRIESLRIWPPDQKSILQIGRFQVPYEILKAQ